jgi:hypothetical protein
VQTTDIKFRFKYSLSAADKSINEGYQQGLANALKRFNVDQVVLSTVEKKLSEDTYLILVISSNDQPVAGIRLEIKSMKSSLPIEKCTTRYQNQIQSKIQQVINSDLKIAELAGLWVDPLEKGRGLGPQLILEATELAFDLGIDTLICMPPQHTFGYFQRLGYVADPDFYMGLPISPIEYKKKIDSEPKGISTWIDFNGKKLNSRTHLPVCTGRHLRFYHLIFF